MGHEIASFPHKTKDAFYTPDYIIKYESIDQERYIIADAKFQTFSTVWNRQISNIAFKYHFSIHPTQDNSFLAGVLILYGKEIGKSCFLESAHDIYANRNIPSFWLSSFTESDICSQHSKFIMIRELLDFLSSSNSL